MPTPVEIETEELVRKWVPDSDSAVRREHLRRRFVSAELEELATGKLRDMLRDGGFTSSGPRQALVEMLLLPRHLRIESFALQAQLRDVMRRGHITEPSATRTTSSQFHSCHRRTMGEAEGEAGVACDPRPRSQHA